MLSRIAESLFWYGRYLERAEDTARMLDVHYHLVLQDPSIDEATACTSLLRVMGLAGSRVVVTDVEDLTMLLVFEAGPGVSVVGSVTAAWENARGVRQVISSEMWECINATHLALPRLASPERSSPPHLLFQWVKERAAMLAGLAETTMSHDDAWRFMVLGRSLERVDMTARLLSTRLVDRWGDAGWATTLRCCSAYEAYLRTFRPPVDAGTAAQFLLADDLFPRSVLAALRQAEECLAMLEPAALRRVGEAARILGLARAEIEFRGVAELLDALPSRLDRVQRHGTAASRAVTERFFRPAAVREWVA